MSTEPMPTQPTTKTNLLSTLILLTASAAGVAAFLTPFLAPPQQGPVAIAAHAQDAPLVFFLLVGLALAAVTADLTAGQMSPQVVAMLGVLTAVAAALRLVPGPGGFSALFLIPILGGYVFGPRFGFLLGVFSMLVSAFITGGVGPWLPYQMFTAGWVGALAGIWGVIVNWRRRPSPHSPLPPSPLSQHWERGEGETRRGGVLESHEGVRGEGLSASPRARWGEIALLALWGAILGLLYGAIMNLWFWPYVFQAQQAGMYWQPGLGLRDTLTRYAAFYLATSLWWDMGRAAGNAVLILAVGKPTVRALRRFRSQMTFITYDA